MRRVDSAAMQLRVEGAMEAARRAAIEAAAFYIKYNPEDVGWCGYAVPQTGEVSNPIVRYMLRRGLAFGPFNGKVHIHYPDETSPRQDIDYQVYVAHAAAHALSKQLGIEVTVASRLT